MASLKDQIAALEPRTWGKPAAMLALAPLLRKDGQTEKALAMCREAIALAPHDAQLAAKARAFLSAGVPGWHFSIVRDQARNAAYDAALRRAVTPGARVLEIGAGAGLLAMMAARAGAAQVITCEANPQIAAKAAEIVALNGYADRVRVISKHSSALDADVDLGGPVDILVSEVVSNNLLGEDVLPTHERAIRNLLKPGGRVIPGRGIVRVALAMDAKYDRHRLSRIDGFDLSPFNDLARPKRMISVGDARLSLRSAGADLFSFDLASPSYCAPAEAALICRSSGGTVNGVAQWIALELDPLTRYEIAPAPRATSNWAAMFHPLAEPVETGPGQAFRVGGAHDRHDLTLWAEPIAASESAAQENADRSINI